VSVIPSTNGTSGPTTTKAIFFDEHHSDRAVKSEMLGGMQGKHIFSDPDDKYKYKKKL